MSALKVLICGDVKGQVRALMKRVVTLNRYSPPSRNFSEPLKRKFLFFSNSVPQVGPLTFYFVLESCSRRLVVILFAQNLNYTTFEICDAGMQSR